MIHLYNVYIPTHHNDTHILGKPKATQCMTVEQLEALNIAGAYGNEETDDGVADEDTAIQTGGLQARFLSGVVPSVQADVANDKKVD